MKKKIRILLLILCLVILAVCGLLFYRDYSKRHASEEKYEEIRKEIKVPETEPQEEQETYVSPINFKKLKKQNEDAYAWIKIEDTRVDYPILQHPSDDSYYLNHTIDHKSGYPGSIYTESVNATDFSDFNTVIYGHDMLNGTMFKDLHKFENTGFFEKHDTVHIYTETEHKEYTIFAAVVFSDRHLMYAYDYQTAEGRKEFLEAVYASNSMKNQFRTGQQVSEDSHILTLSTCIGDQPTKRWLILAVEKDAE